MGPPGVLQVPILGPNRGMFSKLNGPSHLESGGHSYTSFSIGRFHAQWNSFCIDEKCLLREVCSCEGVWVSTLWIAVVTGAGLVLHVHNQM